MPQIEQKPRSRVLFELATEEIRNYGYKRASDVKRGAETPALAALLVEKYGQGIAKVLQLIEELDDERSVFSLLPIIQEEALRLDPQFLSNRTARWGARPAGISIAGTCI
ncbi:MAG: hypothetical protein RL368_1431 [Pseudomonadota bacterium]|jgi:hypothetical protein